MERIADKFVVLACCAGTLALTGTGAVEVASLLACLACALLAEALPGRAAWAAVAAPCALALAVPAAAPFSALPAYDLARRRPPAACACALPALLAGWSGALAAPVVACALLACGCAVLLARRTERALSLRAENLRVADDLRERSLALEAKMRDLMDAQDYEVRLATLSERARIAREIHDNVGHLLTRAVVQAEALRVVCAGEPAVDGVASVAGTLREALDEVRASVHDLRDDATDASVALRAAVESACAGTGLAAETRVEASEVPPAVLSCLLAVTREALSNVLRHAAGATRVRVELVEHPGLWRLTVADDGSGSAPAGTSAGTAPSAAPGGMGLASMEERVRALGGTFRAGPAERGGWVVFASVPRGDGRGRPSFGGRGRG